MRSAGLHQNELRAEKDYMLNHCLQERNERCKKIAAAVKNPLDTTLNNGKRPSVSEINYSKQSNKPNELRKI